MYSLTTLSNDAQEFLIFLNSSGRSKTLITSALLGKAMADIQPLPAQEIGDLSGFFRTSMSIGLQELIGIINEMVLVDVDTVMDYCSKFFAIRYNMAYPSGNVCCLDQTTAVIDLFKIQVQLDKQVLEAIAEAPIQTTKIYNGLVSLLKEIKK